MRVIAQQNLRSCVLTYPDAKGSLIGWKEQLGRVRDLDGLLEIFGKRVDYISNENFEYLTIFNIKGNSYRLAVDLIFPRGEAYLKWFGTHSEYDKIDWRMFKKKRFILC